MSNVTRRKTTPYREPEKFIDDEDEAPPHAQAPSAGTVSCVTLTNLFFSVDRHHGPGEKLELPKAEAVALEDLGALRILA
jgi:hypothetical protein